MFWDLLPSSNSSARQGCLGWLSSGAAHGAAKSQPACCPGTGLLQPASRATLVTSPREQQHWEDRGEQAQLLMAAPLQLETAVQGLHWRVKQLLRGKLQGPEVPSALYFIFFTCSPRHSTLKHVVLHSMATTLTFLYLAVLKSLEAAERGCELLHHTWHLSQDPSISLSGTAGIWYLL